MRLGLVLLVHWTCPVHGVCSKPDYPAAIANLRERLANGTQLSGADYYKDAPGAAVYVYVNLADSSYSSTNHWGAHTAVREYLRVLNQAFLQGSLTTTTPATDTLGSTRFQVKAYNGAVGEPWKTNIKNVLDALPASHKLLMVPTYVLLVPAVAGGIGDTAAVDAALADIEPLLFGADCSTNVTFSHRWWHTVNAAATAGEVEYFASILMAPGVNAANNLWSTPFDGAAHWASVVAANTARMNSYPGKQTFLLEYVHTWDTAALQAAGWSPSQVGEIIMAYKKTVWIETVDIERTWRKWMAVFRTSSYPIGFATEYGRAYRLFLCDFETYYGISRATTTCGLQTPVPQGASIISPDKPPHLPPSPPPPSPPPSSPPPPARCLNVGHPIYYPGLVVAVGVESTGSTNPSNVYTLDGATSDFSVGNGNYHFKDIPTAHPMRIVSAGACTVTRGACGTLVGEHCTGTAEFTISGCADGDLLHVECGIHANMGINRLRYLASCDSTPPPPPSPPTNPAPPASPIGALSPAATVAVVGGCIALAISIAVGVGVGISTSSTGAAPAAVPTISKAFVPQAHLVVKRSWHGAYTTMPLAGEMGNGGVAHAYRL